MCQFGCGFRHEDIPGVCAGQSGGGEKPPRYHDSCALPTTFTLFETRLLTADQNVDRFYDEEDSLTTKTCEKGLDIHCQLYMCIVHVGENILDDNYM